MNKRMGVNQLDSLKLTTAGPSQEMEDEESELQENSMAESEKHMGQNSRRAYLKELRKVVENADVILHVLDARDPLGTRSSAVQELVASNYRKRLVYILNKADLVPREVLVNWLAYLRQTNPVIPFKSNTQNQKSNLGMVKGRVSKDTTSLHTNQAVGTEELIGLLKNYARSGEGKTAICVGVVGYPNVGKSSLINSLMRSRVAGVSSVPGFTTSMQEVILDKTIRILDSPGIVFADGDSAATALRNCVSVEEMTDVLTPIQAILERCPAQYLMQLYNIPRFSDGDCMGFLALVARSTGKLKKGGIPNTDMAARSVLHDWNDGKIKYYCIPPALSVKSNSNDRSATETKILDAFSAELDIDLLAEGVVGALDSHQRGVDEDIYVGINGVGEGMSDVLDDSNMDAAETVGRVASTQSSKAPTKRKGLAKSASASRSATSNTPYDFDTDFK